MRAVLPLGRSWGVGADYWPFYRDSRYDSPELRDHTQSNAEVRPS